MLRPFLKLMLRNAISLGMLALLLLAFGRAAKARDLKPAPKVAQTKSVSTSAKLDAPAAREFKLPVANGDGTVVFLAVGQPSAIKIEGKGEGAAGELIVRKASGKFLATGRLEFNLETLDTGIAMRTRHMKEKYLETGKHPKALLELDALEIPVALAQGAGESATNFTGKLTLHGVQKQVSGTATLKRDTTSVNAQSRFKINLEDFAIDIPKFAGVTVAREVDVSVDFKSKLPEIKAESISK